MKRVHLAIVAAGLTLLASSCRGQENEQEFQRIVAAAKKDPAQYEELVTGVQMILGRLGYGTTFSGRFNESTKVALKEYQRYNRIARTGELNLETWRRLMSDLTVSTTKPTPLPPSQFNGTDWEKGYVSASGSWVNSGDAEPPMPEVSDITCAKDLGYCTESLAILFEGLLKADTNIFEIERWDQFEIVSKPLQSHCTRTVTRINRSQRLVTSIRSKISDDPSCAAVEGSELYSVLKSGAAVYLAQLSTHNAAEKASIRSGSNAVTAPATLH
jgi:hypothetical protein